MSDTRLLRVSRELFLAAFGLHQQGLDSWVIDRLTSLLEEEDLQAGQTISSAGEPPDFVYFMQNGAVRMTRPGKPPWTFQGRWVLGGFEAHLERPLARTSVAFSDFRAMKISSGAWVELLEDSFLLARASMQFSASAVAHLEERVPGGLPKAGYAELPQPTLCVSPTAIERLAFLADVEMLSGAGVQPLAELAAASCEVTFANDQVLLERGRAHTNVMVVVDGEVHAKLEEAGPAWRYGPREVVCGAASFAGALGWEVRAVVPTRALSFPIAVWFDLMDEHFDLLHTALAALGLRREALLDHLAEQSNGIVLC